MFHIYFMVVNNCEENVSFFARKDVDKDLRTNKITRTPVLTESTLVNSVSHRRSNLYATDHKKLF